MLFDDDPTMRGELIDETIAHTQSRLLKLRWSYYVGQHPKVFLTPKLADTFRAISDSLTENYMGLVVNARVQRLEVTGWDGDGANTAEQIWQDGNYALRQDTFYRWGLVHGHAYLAVSEDAMQANPATLMYAHPDMDDWSAVAWAGKCWNDGTDWHAILWDEQSVYRYTAKNRGRKLTQGGVSQTPPGGRDFALESQEPHGFDQVPVVAVNPYGYLGAPLLDQVSPIQDRINKITANKLVAAEFGAFKQRVFFTRQELTADAVKQSPDTAIVLDPGDSDAQARVQEMTATDLRNYDEAKNSEVDALFTVASLPRHMRVNPGSAPSGEAIKADEGPFTESLKDHTREFGEAYQQALRMMGVDAQPIWRDVVVNDEKTSAEVVDKLAAVGMPWSVLATRYLGWTPDEVSEAMLIQGSQQVGAQSQVAAQTAAFLSNPLLES